ncbi:MAG TPA: (2Fe-2S)-binding protein [Casimicrobiaceae bacterium]|nr:(2Fe-2S)-binding protein [Casimicrobiaceae bacterium]
MNQGKARRFTLQVNGREHTLSADENSSLLDVLRNTLKLKGTRFGCGDEQCGACFVLVDGRAVPSCTLPLGSAVDKVITTVEGLGSSDSPHALQQAFLAEQAAQCGYCTSGMLVSAAALLKRTPRPSEAEVKQALDRNLCRCGSHNRIVRAVLRAAAAA